MKTCLSKDLKKNWTKKYTGMPYVSWSEHTYIYFNGNLTYYKRATLTCDSQSDIGCTNKNAKYRIEILNINIYLQQYDCGIQAYLASWLGS